MKYFILIFSLIYLYGTLKSIYPLRTTKEKLDDTISKDKKFKDETYISIYIILTFIVTLVPIIYLVKCMTFVNVFWFSIICVLYLIWTIYDTVNAAEYLKNKTISKMLDSKLYKIISIPLDLGFSVFMIYQVFIKW